MLKVISQLLVGYFVSFLLWQCKCERRNCNKKVNEKKIQVIKEEIKDSFFGVLDGDSIC